MMFQIIKNLLQEKIVAIKINEPTIRKYCQQKKTLLPNMLNLTLKMIKSEKTQINADKNQLQGIEKNRDICLILIQKKRIYFFYLNINLKKDNKILAFIIFKCQNLFCDIVRFFFHPMETIKSIAEGLGIPPEYFLEYRIDKLTKLLKNNPSITDDVYNYAQELAMKKI